MTLDRHILQEIVRRTDDRRLRRGRTIPLALKPRARCTLAEWAQTTYRLSQRRAARLIPVRLNTWRYRLTRDPQDALRQRLRELALVRVRFGY
jgi:hypothetical protein